MSLLAEKKWKRGDVHPVTGKIYWMRVARCRDGEWWMKPEHYAAKRIKVSHSLRRWAVGKKAVISAKQKAYRMANAEAIAKGKARYQRHKLNTDPLFKGVMRLRRRILFVIKNMGFTGK